MADLILSEGEWLAWYKKELKKGWQEDILIPGFTWASDGQAEPITQQPFSNTLPPVNDAGSMP